MEYEIRKKGSFAVIGKLGSTEDGEGFIQRLWQEANAHFEEAAPLAKKTADGGFAGFWGLMSDCEMRFLPWENGFTKGLYLAGVEVEDDAEAPAGWVKWVSPAYEYLVAESGPEAFSQALEHLRQEGLELAGAVYDYTDPKTGAGYQFFPIRKETK